MRLSHLVNLTSVRGEMFHEDQHMPLTSGEFAVLKVLVSHPGEPLSRDKLMSLARGREYSAMERSIDVQNFSFTSHD